MEDYTEIVLIKVGAMLFLGFGSLLTGMIPAIMQKYRGTEPSKDKLQHKAQKSGCVDHSHAPSQVKIFPFLIIVTIDYYTKNITRLKELKTQLCIEVLMYF